MQDWVLVLKAADTAARWHVSQRRKGAAQEPYINHLLEVATLVAQATEGRDQKLVIAALLHDAIEDSEVPRSMIVEAFGEEVAAIVVEVTDDKKLPQDERKRLQIEKAAHKSERARILKLADKTSNLRAMAMSPPSDWSVKRRFDYVNWARAVVDNLRGTNAWLEQQFDEAARQAEDALAPRL